MKSDIFYAMNEINDKYIIEAAQCFEYREENADGFLAKPMVITKIEIYISINGCQESQLQ